MNILYLTWGEVVTNNGIFSNQVLEQVKTIKQLDSNNNIWVISGMPIINSQLLFERANFLQDVERIRRSFGQAGIHFDTRWILAVARWFHSQFYHFPFYSLGQHKFLKDFTQQNRIEIIHCRGYQATRLAVFVRKRYHLSYKVVFDTRGLFPEESVLARYFAKRSWSYKTWKRFEKVMLDSADAVVNVSGTFTEYVKSMTQNSSIYTIYTSTNLDVFKIDLEQKQHVRRKLDIDESQKVLVYLGSIDRKGWHRISNLIAVFKAFKVAFGETKLLIITRSSHNELKEELEQFDFVKTDYILVSANSPDETNRYLQAGDYAVLSYHNVVNDIEKKVAFTVIASKTGEYFAAGLPLIVNQAVGAASKMVEEYGIGCTYVPGHEMMIVDSLNELDSQYDRVREKCTEIARKYFDAYGNAERYINIYRCLSYGQEIDGKII